jgi:hypothetical protein
MKLKQFFIDTEFIETDKTIELVSIALVNDCNEWCYFVSNEFNPDNASEWVKTNVLAKLPPKFSWLPLCEIRLGILQFIGDCTPIFYGHYCHYDWVLFMRLFGGVAKSPFRFCNDLAPKIKGECAEHTALADALWLKKAMLM